MFIAIAILFVVGLIAHFTNKKKGELFQIGFIFTLLATLVSSEWMPSSGTVFDGVFMVGFALILVTSFYLGALISDIILFFTKRKRGEKLEAEEF